VGRADEGHEFDEDTLLSSDSDSSSLTSSDELLPTSILPAATTILPAQRAIDDQRLASASEPSGSLPYSATAPSPFMPIRSSWREDFTTIGQPTRDDNRRAEEARAQIGDENDDVRSTTPRPLA
jgi:hypothetical protein